MESLGKYRRFDILDRLLTFESSDPDSSRVREMISQVYEVVEFPFNEEHFSNVQLCVRRRETV
jgi:hypothetical protein